MKKYLIIGAITILSLFFFNSISFSQQFAPKYNETDIAALPLKDVQLTSSNIRIMLNEISLKYQIKIGLEEVSSDDSPSLSVDMKNGTLADLLSYIVNQDDRYEWEITDNIVNVYPKDEFRDGLIKDLLEVELKEFSVKKDTSSFELAQLVADNPEIKDVMDKNHLELKLPENLSLFYVPALGKNYEVAVSNMKLKFLLNKILRESPILKHWGIGRFGDQNQYLSLTGKGNCDGGIPLITDKTDDQ